MTWEDLDFWDSGEWQVVEEKLDDLDRKGKLYNPKRELIFAALDAVPFERVKVMFCGQDPYPDRNLCMGLAFSIPQGIRKFPPTLNIILDEYASDLHLPKPTSGDLSAWTTEGVLLWNVIPTCLTGISMSHDWVEWSQLTTEIVTKLRDKGIVFAFLGSTAAQYESLIKPIHSYPNCAVVRTGHPSPRGNLRSARPFTGSRLFSTINDHLVNLGLESVNWRL